MKAYLSFILLLAIPLAGCGSKPYTVKTVDKKVYPVSQPRASVCILTYGSEFKLKLTSILVTNLNGDKIGVTVDSISNCGGYSPASYDAVILLSSIEGFTPLKLPADYIVKNQYDRKIVYVSMYYLFAAPYGHGLDSSKIDAITSASTGDDNALKDTAKAILAKVDRIIIAPQTE
jgi:hypothetical protein